MHTCKHTHFICFKCIPPTHVGRVLPNSTFPHFLHSVPKFQFLLQFLVETGIQKQSHSNPLSFTTRSTSPTVASCENSSAHSLAKLSGSCFRTCPSKREVCPVLSFFTKFINYTARHTITALHHSLSNTIKLKYKEHYKKWYRAGTYVDT